MTDQEYFAPSIEQRTLFQEGVCRPGWVGSLPEAPAATLYVPAKPSFRLQVPECRVAAARNARRAHALLNNDYGVSTRYADAAIEAGLVDEEELRGSGRRSRRRWYLS